MTGIEVQSMHFSFLRHIDIGIIDAVQKSFFLYNLH